MKNALFGLLPSVFVALTSCNLFDREPDQSVILSVTKIEAPTTVSTGSSFTVTFTVQFDGCMHFDRLAVEKSNTGVRVVPWGTDATIGHPEIVCPDILRQQSQAIQIDPPFSGPFQVYVDQGRLAPVTATIQVQ
jgi:hypothetical protein